MRTAYFDCFSGAGGDMIVAALVDAGVEPDALERALAGLGIGGYSITIDRVRKQGFAAVRFDVRLDESAQQPHRHLKDVVAIIEAAELPASVKERSIRVFTRLAEAEAAVHGTSVEQVHFHEVGAIDAIIDVVGAVVALDMLGVARVVCSPIPTGSGTVTCQHGVMPVPAPATAHLLRGVPLAACDEKGELTTPTAAAILTTLADGFGPIPGLTLERVGYGAGTREGESRPNLLRVLIGEAVEAAGAEIDEVMVLETNLDDATPQMIGHCMERLLDAGALDVYTVPIQMKKLRPGVLLTVLCGVEGVVDMERIIFTETPTFGIRRHRAMRAKLGRRWETVETAYGAIRVKIGEGAAVVTVTPEYEDCKAAAMEHGVSLRAVMAAAISARESIRE
jgi:pyridinium-3,5-bisthiocarboxylic acid mononucleotide nickel chelatase